jgi:hypothetical protein
MDQWTVSFVSHAVVCRIASSATIPASAGVVGSAGEHSNPPAPESNPNALSVADGFRENLNPESPVAAWIVAQHPTVKKLRNCF